MKIKPTAAFGALKVAMAAVLSSDAESVQPVTRPVVAADLKYAAPGVGVTIVPGCVRAVKLFVGPALIVEVRTAPKTVIANSFACASVAVVPVDTAVLVE